jgi:hypothetical protein
MERSSPWTGSAIAASTTFRTFASLTGAPVITKDGG